MPVDAQLQPFLDLLNAAPKLELGPGSAEEFREQFLAMNPILGAGPEAAVTDRTIPGPAGSIPIRTYRPVGSGDTVLPGVVFFHGGGFVIGSIETHDRDCRALCAEAGVAVVSVEYRLAPEHPFPAAPDDCLAALGWVSANAASLGIDADRLAVAGDSAGGNLAAVTALGWHAGGGSPLRLQALIYPVTDLTPTVEEPGYDSMLENAEGYYLDLATMMWFEQCYIPDKAASREPSCSPQLAPDLAGLPDSLVITCEYDPLRDQGEAYAKRLSDAGVATTLTRYDGGIHGIFSMHQLTDIGRACMDEVVAAVRASLH